MLPHTTQPVQPNVPNQYNSRDRFTNTHWLMGRIRPLYSNILVLIVTITSNKDAGETVSFAGTNLTVITRKFLPVREVKELAGTQI